MPTASPLPPDFMQTVIDVHGDAGRAWLDGLDDALAAARRRWDLGAVTPYPLSYRYVGATTRDDGTACVLKLTVPGDAELAREADYLELVDGAGAVRLLERDLDLGALLLERAVTGQPVSELVAAARDDDATAVMIDIATQLWRAPPQGCAFPAVADFADDLAAYRRTHGDAGPLSGLVAAAERVFDDLLDVGEPHVVLHGDLHHDNVLSSRRGWLAIDPKGYVGEAAYECGVALHNPLDHVRDVIDIERLLRRRAEQLAAGLGLDLERVIAWGMVHAVLSEVWSLDDHGRLNGGPARVARVLLARLGSGRFGHDRGTPRQR